MLFNVYLRGLFKTTSSPHKSSPYSSIPILKKKTIPQKSI